VLNFEQLVKTTSFKFWNFVWNAPKVQEEWLSETLGLPASFVVPGLT